MPRTAPRRRSLLTRPFDVRPGSRRAPSSSPGLRGSAGTFGHDRAADLATELEELLVATAEEPELAVVQGLVEQIDAALAAAPEVEF